MTVSYFLVFLLVLVIAFIVSYFFRDTVKSTIKRIFGGGGTHSSLVNYYDMTVLLEEANLIAANADTLSKDITTEVGADKNLENMDILSKALLKAINEKKDAVHAKFNAYKKIMDNEFTKHIIVKTDNLDKAFKNKNVNELRDAFAAPVAGLGALVPVPTEPLDLGDVVNPNIDDNTFADPLTVRTVMDKNFQNMEAKIHGKLTKTLTKKIRKILNKIYEDQLKPLLEEAKENKDEMDAFYKNLTEVHLLPKEADVQLKNISDMWNEFKEKRSKFIGSKSTNVAVVEVNKKLPTDADLKDHTKTPFNEYISAEIYFKAMKSGVKKGTLTKLGDYKEWIKQWKESFAALKVFTDYLKLNMEDMKKADDILKSYEQLEPLLEHKNNILKEIDEHDKNINSLSNKEIYAAAHKQLEALKTSATGIINTEISKYENALTTAAKALNVADVTKNKEFYIKELKKLEVTRESAMTIKEKADEISKSYEQLEPLLTHMDALTELEKVNKYILSLGYSDVHNEIKDLEKLKTKAVTIIKSQIPTYKGDLDTHIKALDHKNVKTTVDKYVEDLTTLQSLKSQALSIKESAEVKAAQERSLDSSSGDYVFDSQEIISDTKFEEMMSQGKDDEIKATFFKNLVDNDIPKKEIEKIIQKRKEKLRQKQSRV